MSIHDEDFRFVVCSTDDFHPWDCDGPDLCSYCLLPRTDLDPKYVAMKLAKRKKKKKGVS